ncbi:MAG: D-alanyl-D-alanine carboxypeptidase [Oscillospiraceae bacterium]|nr:D-alanyl-D-alanine carboxypeptidase [Oscillospiraceae bacterium]
MNETNEALTPQEAENAWQARAARRREARQLAKKNRQTTLIVLAALLAAVVFLVASAAGNRSPQPEETSAPSTETPTTLPPETEPPTLPPMTWMAFEEDRELTAAQYFVYDVDAAKFLTISGMADDVIYPASVTKLFTAFVALRHMDLDTEITAGSALDLVDPESSIAGIRRGDSLRVETLVEAMLLPSGNDAACILAVETGRILAKDPELDAQAAKDVFMEEMNAQARLMGMTNTHFVNPDGIHDDDHYTCFADLAILGRLVLRNETIMKYAGVSDTVVTLEDGRTLEWKNTNSTINPNSDYYCPYALGLKTGQTSQAGSCLLSAFRCNGRTLIIGVFGCPEKNDRFPDTLQLFNETMGFPFAEPEPVTETNPQSAAE